MCEQDVLFKEDSSISSQSSYYGWYQRNHSIKITYFMSSVSFKDFSTFERRRYSISAMSSANKHIPVSLETSCSGHQAQSKQQSAACSWWNFLNPGVHVTLHVEVGSWNEQSNRHRFQIFFYYHTLHIIFRYLSIFYIPAMKLKDLQYLLHWVTLFVSSLIVEIRNCVFPDQNHPKGLLRRHALLPKGLKSKSRMMNWVGRRQSGII